MSSIIIPLFVEFLNIGGVTSTLDTKSNSGSDAAKFISFSEDPSMYNETRWDDEYVLIIEK